MYWESIRLELRILRKTRTFPDLYFNSFCILWYTNSPLKSSITIVIPSIINQNICLSKLCTLHIKYPKQQQTNSPNNVHNGLKCNHYNTNRHNIIVTKRYFCIRKIEFTLTGFRWIGSKRENIYHLSCLRFWVNSTRMCMARKWKYWRMHYACYILVYALGTYAVHSTGKWRHIIRVEADHSKFTMNIHCSNSTVIDSLAYYINSYSEDFLSVTDNFKSVC